SPAGASSARGRRRSWRRASAGASGACCAWRGGGVRRGARWRGAPARPRAGGHGGPSWSRGGGAGGAPPPPARARTPPAPPRAGLGLLELRQEPLDLEEVFLHLIRGEERAS